MMIIKLMMTIMTMDSLCFLLLRQLFFTLRADECFLIHFRPVSWKQEKKKKTPDPQGIPVVLLRAARDSLYLWRSGFLFVVSFALTIGLRSTRPVVSIPLRRYLCGTSLASSPVSI